MKLFFKKQGLEGDELLNILDCVEDLQRFGATINQNGTATLFHATSSTSAQMILKEQAMFGLENGLFFSTSPNHQIKGYGEVVLAVDVPIRELILDDEFSTEQHYRVAVRPRVKKRFNIINHKKRECDLKNNVTLSFLKWQFL